MSYALFRKMQFFRKPHFFCSIFFCRDRERKYLSRRICEIHWICAGIAITNEITNEKIFHASRLYVVNDKTVNIKVFVLLSQRESFVTAKIFESKILMNFDVFEVPESE